MKKRIIGIILTIALLCGVLIVPTGQQVSAKSKYQKLENAVLDIKKGTDTKYTTSVKTLSKYYVQPMSKFTIKVKNLPKGAKTEFRWKTDEFGATEAECMVCYKNGSSDALMYSTYLDSEQMPKQGWIKFKKNSNKSYTVYIKDVIGDPASYRKNHIYWNIVYWEDVETAIAAYPYEIVVTLKDGTQNIYSGCINVNPVKAQTDYCKIYPLWSEGWFGGKKAQYHQYEDMFTTVEIPRSKKGITEYYLSK
ncbi:MAG: hypothetical protein IKR54_05605 [Lachnospiraceae bacterium]|nr:hypothetical protein [Lachnospiraceae bacterium]